MKLRFAALTDIGKVRPENEDRFLCNEKLGLFGVADGIGGLPGGAEAAACTVDFITAGIKEGVANLTTLTQAANEAVLELGQRLNPAFGIGSTLTYGLFNDGRLALAHVGDSRCYAVKKGRILQLTEDHSLENEARHLRAMGQNVRVSESNRNTLTRCIGQPGLPKVDVQEYPLTPGDRYFFATDGMTRMIPEPALAEILLRDGTPDELLRTIIALALERGGYDNATGVLVFVDEVP